MSTPVISAVHLSKKYGALKAVDDISFSVQKGECLGFLGPNGAGKTTTLKMIYGFSPPSGGELKILGHDVRKSQREIKRKIGVAPQEISLDPDLTVIQNLMIYGNYFDLSQKEADRRSDELLKYFDLTEKKREKLDHLSGGMKRRLLIARALINQPEILILDEPTTGLDPHSRKMMWERLKGLKSQGVTLLLTTHYMEEAEELCDRILMIDYGKIIEEGTPEDLIQKYKVHNLEELFLSLTGKGLKE